MQTKTKYIRVILLLFAMLACSVVSFAQGKAKVDYVQITRERDSLINLTTKTSDNAKLAVLYCEIASRNNQLMQINKVQEPAQKAISLAKPLGDYKTLLNAYLLLGHFYVVDYQSVKALECYLSARRALEKIPNKETDADILTQIGLVYFNNQHFEHAIESFEEALSIYRQLELEPKVISNSKYLATCYSQIDKNEKAIEYYEYLLEKYKEKDDWNNTRMVYNRLNEIYLKIKDYDKIYKYNYDLYNLCTQHNNVKEALNALNNVAYSYVCINQYKKAIKFYNQLLASDKTVYQNDSFDAGTYTSLGLCYQNLHDDNTAIDYLMKAVSLRQKHNEIAEAATVDDIIALIYYKNQDLHNAEFHSKRAVEAADLYAAEGKDPDGTLRAQVYQTYSKILSKKDQPQLAFEYTMKTMELQKNAAVAQDIINRNKMEELKQLTDAEKKFQDGLVEAEISELSNKQLQLLADKEMQENQILQQKMELAEMERKRTEQALALARQQQEAQMRENQIQLLNTQRQADEAALREKEAHEKLLKQEKSLLEEQQKNQKITIQRQEQAAKNMMLLIFLGSAMILFFIVVFFMMRRKNKKLKEQQLEIEKKNADLLMKNEEITVQKENLVVANNEIMTINNELSKQKEIIEKANKSITDSIVYAKRIQTAVCPSPTFLSAFNFDYFLFFRPRDIVSGDYYWFYSDNQRFVYIVAADCTGHGVPGAFMSMLGVSLFNKIVTERGVSEPADILTSLRNEVKSALHQDSINNSSQKDGMDLSLVKYDLENNILTFSGANNNGFLVQRYELDEREMAEANLQKPEFFRESTAGFLKLTVMPADPMPIGVYVREKERFSQTSYQLRKGDSFYLTSDGYIDQFGGEHGRKFLTKNFEKMILDINSYSMKRQEKIIIDTHENWIGENFNQLDDIIVVGIRV